MEKLKFKTNIKCGSCLAKVEPYLNANSEIQSWEIDLKDKDRVLSVEIDQNITERIKKDIAGLGYSIELKND